MGFHASGGSTPDNVTLELNGSGLLALKSSGVGTTQIANNSVTGAKIAVGSDAQGDILYYDGTDWVRLPAGTNGQLLRTLGAGANPSWVTAAGWTLIERRTIGSNSQTQDFTSLDGNTDENYMLFGRIKNNNAGTALISVRLNSANWAGNKQQQEFNNTVSNPTRSTDTFVIIVPTGSTSAFWILFPTVVTGFERHAMFETAYATGTSIEDISGKFYFSTPTNSANITAIGLGSDVADGIGTGSELILMKVTG